MKVEVFAKCKIQGRHCWKSQPKGSSREYLSNVHRHVFHIEVGASVGHMDRELEILQLKQEIFAVVAEKYPAANDVNQSEYRFAGDTCFSEHSCEMIAKVIFELLRIKGIPVTYCIVSEDGENGAKVSM